MIELNRIYHPSVLNIFSDASIIKPRKNIYYGCYGAVAVSENKIIDSSYQVCADTTSNDSEIRGVRSAVSLAVKYKHKFPIINIFSDSQISLFGVRERCFNWTENNGVLYGYDNKTPIKNQSVFIEVMRIIVENNMQVYYFHQKGHVNIRKKKSLNEALHVFLASNQLREDVDIEFIKYISYYNDIVDNESRRILKQTKINQLPYVQPIRFLPVDYYNLVDTYNKTLKGEIDYGITK